LWALKYHVSDILDHFKDQTAPADCLIFYRPSFGRSGGKGRAEFGEFDAIIVSSENVYLIESKWDSLSRFKDDKIIIRPEQQLRHRIFSWYLMHWDKKYSNNWESFVEEHQYDFQKKFQGKTIAPTSSLLAENLEFILIRLLGNCQNFSNGENIKNVLLFFHNEKWSVTPTKIITDFNLVNVDYSQDVSGNFIALESQILGR